MRRLKDDFGFHQVMAPEFFALLDRCAAELGCKAPDRVAVRSDYNAATGRAGLAQRSFLLLGAPLWTVLSGPERVALLGHELAHQVNGDATHGTWALSARRSLSEWTKLLDPRETGAERAGRRRLYRSGRAGQAGLASMLAPLLMTLVFAPFFLIAVGCRALLLRLDLQCGQRAEYLADDLGSRLAGSAATEGLLCKLVFRESLTPFVNARRARRPKPSPELLWSDFRDYVESIPEYEFQRRIVLDRLHGTRIDRTHPANHHRIALTGARPRRPGVVTVTDEQWAAIDAELAPYLTAAAKRALG